LFSSHAVKNKLTRFIFIYLFSSCAIEKNSKKYLPRTELILQNAAEINCQRKQITGEKLIASKHQENIEIAQTSRLISPEKSVRDSESVSDCLENTSNDKCQSSAVHRSTRKRTASRRLFDSIENFGCSPSLLCSSTPKSKKMVRNITYVGLDLIYL